MELNRKTIQNWRQYGGTTDKRKGSDRLVAHKLSALEEETFYNVANGPRFRDCTPEQIVAKLAEEGIYHASASTLYRIFKKREANKHRAETKKPVANKKAVPILVTGPNQVWAWDITWLKTDVVGLFKYGYNIIDLWDRVIVGWAIENTESDDNARRLFERIIRDLLVVPQIIHADNGGPMRGVSLGAFLDSLCVTRSHSRPRCSNDNAFIESWHKTLKHTVGYPAFLPPLSMPEPGMQILSHGTTMSTFIHLWTMLHRINDGAVKPLKSTVKETRPFLLPKRKTPCAGVLEKCAPTTPYRSQCHAVRCRRLLDANLS